MVVVTGFGVVVLTDFGVVVVADVSPSMLYK